MNVKTVKKPKPRVETDYLGRLNIQAYGYDNLYPQHLNSITGSSGTASLCLERYSKFVGGGGFQDKALAAFILNNANETAADILQNVAADVARFGGYALHVNYNVLGQIVEVRHVPFENCRLEETDERGNVNHICVHPDWTGNKTRNGRRLNVSEENIDRINVFNPNPAVVVSQMEAAGGVMLYKGQILWRSTAGKFTYPIPIYDAAITDISTDEGLANIKCRNARNNFMIACMLVTKKGLPKVDENGVEHDEEMISADDLQDFQGDENCGKIMKVTLENDEDEPKVVPFPTSNWDREFVQTENSVISRIYAQFHQELFYSIRIGKLGFSGQVMQDAYGQYAGEVTTEQRFIERGFAAILSAFVDGSIQGANVTIEPLKYVSLDNNTITE